MPTLTQAAAMGEGAVKGTFEDLEKSGFINKRLRLPHRTKREYFWLLIMHVLFRDGFGLVADRRAECF